MTKKVIGKKCDMTASDIYGYRWAESHRCPGVAVIKATFPDKVLFLCIAHGRQMRFNSGLEIPPKLDTVDPFPTLEDALDVILGTPAPFISLACRDSAHDGCRLIIGHRICECKDCEHEYADADAEFEEE